MCAKNLETTSIARIFDHSHRVHFAVISIFTYLTTAIVAMEVSTEKSEVEMLDIFSGVQKELDNELDLREVGVYIRLCLHSSLGSVHLEHSQMFQ